MKKNAMVAEHAPQPATRVLLLWLTARQSLYVRIIAMDLETVFPPVDKCDFF